MPEIHEATPISSVLGVDRQGARRHTFVGGNFLLANILNQYRDELERHGATAATFRRGARGSGISADPGGASECRQRRAKRKYADCVGSVQNLTGHKLPTAYPSRRAWLHFVVRDNSGQVVFESGKLRRDGSIVGNDNDDDPLRFEPHYTKIERGDQVEIYEDIMKDQTGHVTTGLLHAVGYMQRQPPAPIRVSTRKRPRQRLPSLAKRPPTLASQPAKTVCSIPSGWATRKGLSALRPNFATSRLVFAGRTICCAITRWNRNGSFATTTRCRQTNAVVLARAEAKQ